MLMADCVSTSCNERQQADCVLCPGMPFDTDKLKRIMTYQMFSIKLACNMFPFKNSMTHTRSGQYAFSYSCGKDREDNRLYCIMSSLFIDVSLEVIRAGAQCYKPT